MNQFLLSNHQFKSNIKSLNTRILHQFLESLLIFTQIYFDYLLYINYISIKSNSTNETYIKKQFHSILTNIIHLSLYLSRIENFVHQVYNIHSHLYKKCFISISMKKLEFLQFLALQ